MIEDTFDHLVQLQPDAPLFYACQGRTALVTDHEGLIEPDTHCGLFVHETRLLSRLAYRVNGEAPRLVVSSNVNERSWLGYYIAADPRSPREDVAARTLELRVSRFVGDGLHEDLDVANYTQERVRFRLEVLVDADFADTAEVRKKRQQTGWTTRTPGESALRIEYRARHRYAHQGNAGVARIRRAVTLRILGSDSPPTVRRRAIRFEIDLDPLGTWHACLEAVPEIDGTRLQPIYGCRAFASRRTERDQRRLEFLERSTRVTIDRPPIRARVLESALDQARHDLASLRLYDLDHGPHAWTVAAGLPLYIALFGRDTLFAATQAGLLGTDLLRGTLLELPRWQGREENAWRDEQPGRMLHEAHTGPLEALRYNPRSRYYGSIATSAVFATAVAELWRWTADRATVEELLPAVERALAWIDREADLDGDGFYEFRTRSEQGLRNQGWKDSPDAIVYEDGSQVEPPIATVEMQGLVYQAKVELAELLDDLGRGEDARRLRREAGELRARFHEAFWLDDEDAYAMALDPGKRPVRSMASDGGHALTTGIAEAEVAERCARRLLAKDMFSGWGVRTLSCEHPAYDPYSYHRGSVWPVEQGQLAWGFARYGLPDLVEQLLRAQLDAARLFRWTRLPECMSGHPRDDAHPFPAIYPRSNSPQAWSCSVLFRLLQALLGLEADAPAGTLRLDPHLPEWLPDLTLDHLRVGEATLSIRFRRVGRATTFEVLEQRGRLSVVRQPLGPAVEKARVAT